MFYFLESKEPLRIFKKHLIDFGNYAEDLLLLSLGMPIWAFSTRLLQISNPWETSWKDTLKLLFASKNITKGFAGAGNHTKASTPERGCCLPIPIKGQPQPSICTRDHISALLMGVTPATILTLFCSAHFSSDGLLWKHANMLSYHLTLTKIK